MTLGEKLVQLRRARGVSQETLAEAVGVSRQAVSKWELGDALPELDKLVALAAYYGVTTDYLLCAQSVDPQAVPAPADRVCLTPAAAMAVSLAGSAAGLLLLFHGRFISASEWPSIAGLIAQIVFLACGLAYFIPLRTTGPNGSRLLRLFLRLEVWLVALFPCLFTVRLLFRFKPGPYYALHPFLLGMALYLVICVLTDLLTLVRRPSKK